MYKQETIKKIREALSNKTREYLSELEAGKKLRLSISKNNMKIGNVLNVSIAPLLSCGNCGKCAPYCYDVKACLMYKVVLEARARNMAIFLHDRDEFFKQIENKMRRRRSNKYLRMHVSGELMDIDHFNRIVKLAVKFPDFKVWTYTKMYWIVNEWIEKNGPLPENFKVMLSEWKGVPMNNRYNLPVFRCAFDESDKIGFKCPGQCDICKKNNTGCIAGMNTWVPLH